MLSRKLFRFPIRKFSTVRPPTAKIINSQTILSDVDKIVRPLGSPFWEYIYCKPNYLPTKQSFLELVRDFFTFRRNLYGHGLVRYHGYRINPIYPDKVMNVSGKGDNLINFFEPADYLFGEAKPGNPQAGITERSFITIRCDNVDSDIVNKMDDYYNKTEEEGKKGNAKFSLLTAMFTNYCRPFFHKSEQGNCAYWTSQGFVAAGILKTPSNWPLLIFFRLLYSQTINNINNINVVLYRSIHHMNQPKGGLIFPVYWMQHGYEKIWNLDNFATVIVEPVLQEDNTYKLVVTENKAGREFWLKIQKELLKIKKIKREFGNVRKNY
jgi:hypothetical protein